MSSELRRVALIGDYPPRKCGIATFTSDLCAALARQRPDIEFFVVSVNDLEVGYEYPAEVRFEIEQHGLASYQRAADFLNISNVDVVCLQHEFGLFGGPSGSHILALLRNVKAPIVVTLHTLLRQPDADKLRIINELTVRSTRLVTMTNRGREFMESIYQAQPSRIDLIPHGIPDVPFVDPNFFKDKFGVEGKKVLLTFGLLSPNKGIEHMLNALPAIAAQCPDVVYIVLGATHPNLLREEGEAYRLSLERLAKKNRVQKHVIFHNRFVSLEELMEFLGAADIYITPYLNEAQITSGTLAYALGAGKAIVSTPYWHAQELLAEERGVLVPFGDSAAIAREVLSLLQDEARRNVIRKNAYLFGREMIWSHVAELYLHSFEQARMQLAGQARHFIPVKTLDERPPEMPALKLDHLFRMTDSTGLFQHATFSIPNFSEGYCTDDNARALILTVLLEELHEDPTRVRDLATIYAAFLNHAFDPALKRFRNFMSFDRKWLEAHGSEDSQSRALWALGVTVGRSQRRSFHAWAGQLFEQALPAAMEFSAPRAWAFALLGIDEYSRRLGGARVANQARERLNACLLQLFEGGASEAWPWCEDFLTYDNARLAHALIVTGSATGQSAEVKRGLQALSWLLAQQTSEEGFFRPIGNQGFYRRGEVRPVFDQQPLEAQATVSACLAAYRVTGEASWLSHAHRAFEWFLGWNDLGLELYLPNTGGCRDGLLVDRVNPNQGAESTLAFLLSLAEMKLVENAALVSAASAAA